MGHALAGGVRGRDYQDRMARERARPAAEQHDASGLEVNLNTSGNFADTNANKKSLSLNVRSPKGLEVVKRLIAVSDIVIENFSSRVLRKWGLGYEELCKIKPDIVYVSMSGYGHTRRCCMDQRSGRSIPSPVRRHMTRTEFGRPTGLFNAAQIAL